MLREAGYQVRLAQSARRALAALAAEPPELILLDVNMPEMNGFELCRALRAEPGSPRCRSSSSRRSTTSPPR
jgi:putative two-component system response regulator